MGISLACRGCCTVAFFATTTFEGGIVASLFMAQPKLCFSLQTTDQHQQLRATRRGTCEEYHTFSFTPRWKSKKFTLDHLRQFSLNITTIFTDFESRNDPED